MAAPSTPPALPPPPLSPPSSPGGDAGWTVIVGIFLGLTASVGINLGNNLQALGLQQMATTGTDQKPLVWKWGFGIFAFASLINFGAFGFAPAAVLAPLESIQFVTNLLFGKFVNKAVITKRMVRGSMLVVLGCIIAVVFGPNQVAQFDADELAAFWGDTWWILYLSFLGGFCIASQLVHMRFEAARSAGHPYKHSSIILPVTFATSSAVVGSMCVVMSKCMSELVEIFVTEGADVLATPLFYISLVLTVIFLCGWLYRLNAALGKYDPLFIIPLLQSNYILFSISSGGVYFQEFGMLDFKGWILFLLGICVMFSGLFLLAPVDRAGENMMAGGRSSGGGVSQLVVPGTQPASAAAVHADDDGCGPGTMLSKGYAAPYTPTAPAHEGGRGVPVAAEVQVLDKLGADARIESFPLRDKLGQDNGSTAATEAVVATAVVADVAAGAESVEGVQTAVQVMVVQSDALREGESAGAVGGHVAMMN